MHAIHFAENKLLHNFEQTPFGAMEISTEFATTLPEYMELHNILHKNVVNSRH